MTAISAVRRLRLRRSRCDGPGITRRRRGKGFAYYYDDGTRVTDANVLSRISGLVLPPAWRDVWICPWANGHVQALGTDAAGRRQYRYHDDWRLMRERAIARAYRKVAGYLGNTPAVCRKSYVDLKVVDLFEQGVTIAPALEKLGSEPQYGLATQGAVEQAVVRMLTRPKRPSRAKAS